MRVCLPKKNRGVPTKKVSISLNKQLLAEAREVAGPRRLSRYVNRALRLQLQHHRIRVAREEDDSLKTGEVKPSP